MTTYAAVTTCSDAMFETFGRKMQESWAAHWPIELTLIREGRLLELSRGLREFRARAGLPVFAGCINGEYHYRMDALRFAWKVFAILDGGVQADVLFWVDADTVTTKDVPMSFVEGLLPDDCYTACLRRSHMYTEGGFVAYRRTHKAHEPFMAAWRYLYDTGSLFLLPEWHDCYTYDQVRLAMEAADLVKTHNLTPPEAMDDLHPFDRSPLAEYMTHHKGPERKAAAQARAAEA